jgi:hypothetical protein
VKLHNVREQKDKHYEMWVFSRMNDKTVLCHLYKGHRCIPADDESCRSCYREFRNSLGRSLLQQNGDDGR